MSTMKESGVSKNPSNACKRIENHYQTETVVLARLRLKRLGGRSYKSLAKRSTCLNVTCDSLHEYSINWDPGLMCWVSLRTSGTVD
jgi:hypothetical protein